MKTYQNGDELFDTVFENSLNGVDPETLTEKEIKLQEKWVNENWEELLNYE